MAGFPRSDIEADNWQTTAPDDWSWLDHLKAYGSDARKSLGNLGSNILDGVSPFAPTATQQGQPSLQVPPMLQGIADSYSRLAGTPSKPGNAYDLTGVPELDAPIQGDMSNVLLSLYGGNALRGRGPALRSEKHRSDTTAHHIVDAELMPDDFRFGASSNVQEASSKFWPTSWGPEDISQWPSSTIERARLFVRRQEAEDQWVPMVDNIMWPDANRQQVMGRSEAEALLLSQRPELKTVADAVYSARRDFYENANPNWRNDPYRVLNEPRYPGVPSPLTEVPNVLSRPKSDVATRYLLSDTGKPSLFGSALATAGEQPKGALGAGYVKGARPEPSASTPKAEAMGRSAVLAENEASKLAEDAYVKAYRQNLDENKYRYFDDWTDDPNNPIIADDWGNQIGGEEISDGFSNASPYGYRALNTVPATAYGINEAALAAGRDLWLSQSANSASHYGTLKTPSGKEYKVRVADHAKTSSKFDQPDFNIAPGEMTPEEFVRLMPTLLSDTGKPSLLGSALATAGEQPKGITAYHGSPHDFDKFSLDKIGTGEGAQAYGHGLYFAENEGVAKSYRDTLAATKTSQQDLNSIVDGQDISRSDKSFLKRVADAKWNHREQGDYSQLIDEYTNLFGPPDNIEAVKKAAEALPNGKMYQVRINADPESFLDWDKPLSQQSQNARNALAAIPNSGPRYEAWDRHGNNVSVNDGATPYLGTYDEAIKAAGKGGRVVADESYNDLQSLIRGNEDKLKEAGIPGIRYLDGNSRGKGEGSSNYVVFDDSLIEILKKYGLAGGAVGAGALNSLSQDPQIY